MTGFLSKSQVQELESELKLEDKRRFADRIRVILLLDRGWTAVKIAEALFLDESTVRRYKNAYELGGLEELIDDGYQGGVNKLSTTQEKELKIHLKENIYLHTKSIIVYIKRTYDVRFTSSGIRDLLHRLGFSYKKPKLVPGKANPELQEAFLEKYEFLRENIGKNDRIYFADAAHPHHNTMVGYGWIPKGETAEIKSRSGRERLNLIGAIDITDHDLIVQSWDTINGESVVAFLKDVEERNPRANQIYLIVDNAKYFYSWQVAGYLAQSKVRLIFLPSYSPNLNLIERFWKFFYKKILYNQYHDETLGQFEDRCLRFFGKIKKYKTELASLLTEEFEMVRPHATG